MDTRNNEAFERWLNEHGMESAAPLPDLLNGLIMLVTEGLGSQDMREFLTEFLRELVQVNPDMSLKEFAALVRDGLNADLTKPGGGFLPFGEIRIH